MAPTYLQLCPRDCLAQDSRGEWSITFWRKKTKNHHTLPISREIAKVVQQQQEYIKQNLGYDFKYLFCNLEITQGNLDASKPKPIVIRRDRFSYAINRLLKNEQIKDENGQILVFKPHQLRDTRATHLFETGHEFAVVSKWLGHRDAGTTQKYIHVQNHTLRNETALVQAILTNIRGDILTLKALPKSFQDNPNAHTLARVNAPYFV